MVAMMFEIVLTKFEPATATVSVWPFPMANKSAAMTSSNFAAAHHH
jgi:hypothetical protein